MENNAVLKTKIEKKQGWKWRYLALPFLVYFIYAFIFGSGWLLYREGSYHGKVIDAETGEPIEGAVVVAVYHVEMYAIVESSSYVSSVKEVLTDKNGEFNISPHIYFFPYPAAKGDTTTFIVYKPGYTAFGGLGDYFTYFPKSPLYVNRPTLEKYFEEGVTVTLKRLETKKERLMNIPVRPGDMGSDRLPLLFKAINEERAIYGLGELW